jgi:AraC-like DNA-binding protein
MQYGNAPLAAGRVAGPAVAVQRRRPAVALRAYIDHYWLSLDNRDATFCIVPDGAVDVVVESGAATLRATAFGSTTHRTDIALDIGAHYLGIRFKPGQSRHFLDAPARELTDSVQPVAGPWVPSLLDAVAAIATGSVFERLDAGLLAHLERRPARESRIDAVIRTLETTPCTWRVSALADLYGKSRRQLERRFLDAVGLPVKTFARILRVRRAAALLARSHLPLAQVATELGYADQSHFTREFARFYGLPPARARTRVAFVQDAVPVGEHTAGSLDPSRSRS